MDPTQNHLLLRRLFLVSTAFLFGVTALSGCLDGSGSAMAMPTTESLLGSRPAPGPSTPATPVPAAADETDESEAPAQGTPAPGEEPAATSIAFDLVDCAFGVALLPVDDAALWPYVPDGFRLVDPAEAGLPPDVRGDAVFIVTMGTCARVESAYGTSTNVPFAFYAAIVEPRADLRVEGVEDYAVFWDVLVGDAALRAALAAEGLPARGGTVGDEDLGVDIGGAHGVHYDLHFEGEGVQELFGAAPLSEGEHFPDLVAYSATPDGLARWYFEFDIPESWAGAAWYQAAAGTFPAQFVGSDPVVVLAGYERGTTHAVVRAP